MLMITSFLCITTCVLTVATAQQYDILTTCAPEGYIENIQSDVFCSVNRQFFDACFPVPKIVTFTFSPSSGGSDIPWCSTNYTACENTGSSKPDCYGCSCKCVNRTTDASTYELTFVPAMSYKNGSFSCKLTCLTDNPSANHTSCEGITVVPATTGAPNTTETNLTSSEASGSSTSTAPPSPSDSTSTPSTPLTKTAEVPTPTPSPATNSTRESNGLHPWQEGLIAGGGFVVTCGGTVFIVVIVRRRRSRRTQKELPCDGDRTVHVNGNFSNGSINNEEHSHVSRF